MIPVILICGYVLLLLVFLRLGDINDTLCEIRDALHRMEEGE